MNLSCLICSLLSPIHPVSPSEDSGLLPSHWHKHTHCLRTTAPRICSTRSGLCHLRSYITIGLVCRVRPRTPRLQKVFNPTVISPPLFGGYSVNAKWKEICCQRTANNALWHIKHLLDIVLTGKQKCNLQSQYLGTSTLWYCEMDPLSLRPKFNPKLYNCILVT